MKTVWVLEFLYDDKVTHRLGLFSSRDAALEYHAQAYPEIDPDYWEQTFEDCWNYDLGNLYMHLLYEETLLA